MNAVLDAISAATLENNLAALEICSSRAAALIRSASPRHDITFHTTDDTGPDGKPALSASIGTPPGRLLASKRRPIDEAVRFAATIQVESTAAVVVMGFGLGYHVAAVARRLKADLLSPNGVIFVYEPDVALLRSVLERVDHSALLASHRIILLTDPDDTSAISASVRGVEGLMAMGLKFLEHPASVARLATGGASTRFRDHIAAAVRSVRTMVVTTLVQSEVTLRNMLMNLDRFTTGPGIADLKGCAAGRPAIVVAAGPSLRRNIALLARPGVRDRFVIIAVQTVLKTLLSHGIRPHFVTALDYHEICRRFYEGLTPADVEGVTLVAEPKANPAIFEAFPGAIRCVADSFLTDLLGPDLAGDKGEVPPGSTVAHLACYLARYMGCDPLILVGQDLGFTDGQYYAAGAAIHDVWSGELNPFNTLEMMEWQRIARGRRTLHRTTDVLGRPIYTDEQMGTYLAQFEREFLADHEQGRTTIDATEGGVAKAHTRAMTLEAALAGCAPADSVSLPAPIPPAGAPASRVDERIRAIRRDIWKLGELSRATGVALEEMLAHHEDQKQVNELIGRVYKMRDEVNTLKDARRLVDRLNQAGEFNRVKADRALGYATELTPLERQRRQIERDIANVRWLADAADQLGGMIDDGIKCLAGAPKITRDPPPADETSPNAADRRPAAKRMIKALIPIDFETGGLDTPRRIDAPFLDGLNPLQLALARLARCTRLDGVVLICADPERARRLVGAPPAGLTVEFAPCDGPPMGARARPVGVARLWAAPCWRAGLAGSTIYDEVACPVTMAPIMDRLKIDAGVLVGADWALIDPQLVDDVIERHLERPDRRRIAFAQAPPGLGACLVERGLMGELAARAESAGVFASLGAALGYIPIAPTSDPIAAAWCVSVPAEIRDSQARFIPDSEPRRRLLAAALEPLGAGIRGASAAEIARLVASCPAADSVPHELLLELCTGRRAGGRSAWLQRSAEPPERSPMPVELARRIFEDLGDGRADAVVTLTGAGDPILHPDLSRVIADAKRAGIAAVHVRTDLIADRSVVDTLLDSGADVISVDLMAETAETYRRIMGADHFATVRANLEHLIKRRAGAGGLPRPWIVPRLTRCDAVYQEIESFFDRWIMSAGAAVIDPRPDGAGPERIQPLPPPAGAARRLWRSRMLVLCDGRVPMGERDLGGERVAGDVSKEPLADIWKRVEAHRRRMFETHGPAQSDLWTGL